MEESTIVYRPDTNQSLDIYWPSEGENFPVALYIHGGSWTHRSKDDYAFLSKLFVPQGIALVVNDYSLSPENIEEGRVMHPTHTLDCAASVQWIAQHAAEFSMDPSKIFVLGHSAGGHMAGLLALDPFYLGHFGESNEALVRGFVAIESIFDLCSLSEDFPTYASVRMFIEPAFGTEKEKWATMCPQYQPVEGKSYSKAPWLVIHSTEDKLVNSRQSDTFVTHLRSLGIKVEYKLDSYGKHFDPVHKMEQTGVLSILLDWIKKTV